MDKRTKTLSLTVCVSMALGTSGCASTTNTVLGCAWGAAVGTVGGLIAGKGDLKYAAVGAAAGLIVGCGVGYYMDQREEELAKQAEANGFKPEFERLQMSDGKPTFSVDAEEDVIASQVALTTDKPMFRSGASQISDPKIRTQLDSFLAQYVKTLDRKSKVYVVGHTDSSGSASMNQRLSEKRAYYIAQRLNQLGLEKNRIFYEGVGENQPIAPNESAEGRSKNRRFELVDVFVDDVAKSAASLEQVLQVSKSKKQRIENVMTPEALAYKAKQKEIAVAKDKAEKEGTNVPKPKPVVANKTKQSIAKAPVKKTNVKDQNALNLYGQPLDGGASGRLISSRLGNYIDDSLSLFPKAYAADNSMIQSCGFSEPKAESTIKSLGNVNYQPAIGEGLPTLFGNYWYGKATSPTGANETMVVLGPVFIAKETFEAAKHPEIMFTKDYKSSSQKPNYSYQNTVETYRGDDTVLYRIYPTSSKAKFECADVIFNSKGSLNTEHAEIIYNSKGTTFSRVMELKTII
ncbi:OmpA family protein [Vibrio sp. OPT18]|uniref:OmpA family protein n=1 Tax=Vibrio sp. OPT18 TaxID=2778641 RepID=UPI00187FB8C8|nr:OmpA family protein [Vibrio sp. OPT18]MBE8577983.1 OmpA family protein [Vibrio sp. OPT18]